MKRRFYSKVSIIVCIALLFCCLPFRVVYASSVQDQSKPIFGLTADDVVEKYNQLSNQQKSQVLRSLGNTSIFANSLFGNIFNSTFGALDDAIEKLGDLFFQANGVIYKLGSSALAWVSRLIDKVFNNDLNNVNISQPVVDDFYKNTRDLVFVSDPFFVNGHLPSYITNTSYLSNFNNIFPLPYNCCFTVSNYGSFYSLPLSEIGTYNVYNCLVVDLDKHIIRFGSLGLNNRINDGFEVLSLVPTNLPSVWSVNYKNYSLASPGWRDYSGFYYDIPFVSFVGNDYLPVLKNFLNTYFVSIDSYVIKMDNIAYQRYIDHSSNSYNVTNNTYYNYIYNIPDQTPLNVTNIVSNTAIDYNPVDNIAYYLPDQYNIEQNFLVVNNYYISSGSSITTGSVIDVNLVSPSVIDVRITNPEDISNLVENNTIKEIINNNEFNAGDLNLNTTINTVIDSSNDSLSVVSNDSVGLISALYSCIPAELMGLYVVEVIVGIVVIWLNVVNHKHK